MFGSGSELPKIKSLINKLDVKDCVNLCGNRPNDEILEIIREHHIFLFTSDRNEGWGAVVNEAMSNGCAVVASDAVGSVPFLINSGENGLIFNDQNLDDLYLKTMVLIKSPELREQIVRNSYSTMYNLWSPQNAAKNFIKLAKSALQNKIEAVKDGPGSTAK